MKDFADFKQAVMPPKKPLAPKQPRSTNRLPHSVKYQINRSPPRTRCLN